MAAEEGDRGPPPLPAPQQEEKGVVFAHDAGAGSAVFHGASCRSGVLGFGGELVRGCSGERVADDAALAGGGGRRADASAEAAANGMCDFAPGESEVAAEAMEDSGKDEVDVQVVDASHVSDMPASAADVAALGHHSCRNGIGEVGDVAKLPKKHGNGHAKKRDPKRKAAQSQPGRIDVVSSKRTLNRDLPDQLEAHAHRVIRDAGWTITPRPRINRTKMAYYFAAPKREVVVGSLSLAWKACGQRLHKAAGGLEWGKFPMEWSDADPFWKDLVDTMAYIGKMTANGENSLTLLRRWQLLDPFLAVVFIDKRITVLQKRKTLRAVDCSTSVLDDDESTPSENKSTLPSPSSGYSQVATDNCDSHQDIQNFNHSSRSNGSHVSPELCRTQGRSYEVPVHAENNIQSNIESETGKICSEANLCNTMVKRVRKKSKWICDFESTGLNGLFAQSFVQSTIGLSKPGDCSAGSTTKNNMKAKSKLGKLNGEKRELSQPSKRDGISGSGAHIVVAVKKQQSRPLEKSSSGVLSEDVVAVSNDRNGNIELSHRHSATVMECSMSLEAQSCKKFATKRKSEIWEKNARRRPSEMRCNDDDLLITAIVKNKDISSFHKCASRLVLPNANFRKLKSPKRDNRLLIQTAGKGGTNLLDGRQIALARKTVLCWLIATGFLTLKDVVQCRNPKSKEILKDGWVTWDGILCNCCIKTLSIPDFKAHADSSLPISSLNLCLHSGKSFTLCQLEAWTAEYMDRRNNTCIRKVKEVDENDDTCGFCGDGGDLICCDNCPSTYHQACLSAKDLPVGSWYCHNCICRNCGYPVSEKEVSSFSATLKCLQCGDAYHDTCVETERMASEDMDSDTWFCGRHCKEIFVGLHGHVGLENFLGEGLSWTILRCNSDGQQLRSVQKIAHMVECNTKLAVALTLMEECFVRMVDTRTGIDMIPHVLYNQRSKYARLDYQGFYTVILEKGDEILCAASIRVHGTKAAELPFIATCAEYRRQGMCRRLINTIEETLRSFHVKVLVLSAIPELVSTWVSGFGFKPIQEDERKQLDTINLMIFPGTSLLIKSLEDHTDLIKSGDEKDGYGVSGLIKNNCIPNGRGSEHFEHHDLDLLEVNSEKVPASLRQSKDECKPAAWHQSAQLTIGEV